MRAFLPRPLPPKPALSIDSNFREKLDDALLALGRLDSVTTLLPDAYLFLYMYVRKEAVLSSQIEGTKSSLSDPLLCLSLYLKKNRDEYYRLLDVARSDGDWESWISFFAPS